MVNKAGKGGRFEKSDDFRLITEKKTHFFVLCAGQFNCSRPLTGHRHNYIRFWATIHLEIATGCRLNSYACRPGDQLDP